VLHGDAYTVLDTLEPNSIDCVFTSPNPPFYSKTGIGSEKRQIEYIDNLMNIFDKMKDIVKDTGSVFVHMGDYHDDYGNFRMIPERFALDMQDNDWILRSKLIWHRTEDRPRQDKTRFRIDWEYILWFVKTDKYYFNDKHSDTSVWSYPYYEPEPRKFESGIPLVIIEKLIQSTCVPGNTVMDPFAGTGTTGVVALDQGMNFIGIELKAENIIRIRKRLSKQDNP
jgi:DNA modification methylase